MADNTLFGVTPTGGSGGSGTIYALTLAEATPIILGEQTSGKYLILNWANPAVILEAASNVGGPYTPIPGATSPFTVGTTNPQQFSDSKPIEPKNNRDSRLVPEVISKRWRTVSSSTWFQFEVSPDGRQAAAPLQNGELRLYDATSGDLTASLRGHQGAASDACFSPDGRLVMTTSGGREAVKL